MSNLPIEEDVKVSTNNDLKLSIQKRDVVLLLLAYNAAFIVSWILGKNDLFNCFVVSCFIALLVPFIIVANKMFQKVYIEEELKLQETEKEIGRKIREEYIRVCQLKKKHDLLRKVGSVDNPPVSLDSDSTTKKKVHFFYIDKFGIHELPKDI